jgi:hypothetical protein
MFWARKNAAGTFAAPKVSAPCTDPGIKSDQRLSVLFRVPKATTMNSRGITQAKPTGRHPAGSGTGAEGNQLSALSCRPAKPKADG